MATASFVVTGNSDPLISSLRAAQREFNALDEQARLAGTGIDSALARVKSFALQWGSMAGVSAGGFALLNQIKEVSTEMQNTQAQFKVFLKSSEAAEAFMDRLNSFAFNNVFEFKDLASASAQLLAYGTDVNDITDKLHNLSEVAAGTGRSIGEMVGLYNKVKAADVVDSRTEVQLKNAGIDIKKVLEQARDLNEGALKNTKMRFQDLDEALQIVSNDGGMYAGMMEEKMKTIGDSVGLLQDAVTRMFASMGEKIQEPMVGALKFTAELADNWEEVLSILGKIVVAYGVYKGVAAFNKALDNAKVTFALNQEKEMLDEVIKKEQEYNQLQLRKQVAARTNNGQNPTDNKGQKARIRELQELEKIQKKNGESLSKAQQEELRNLQNIQNARKELAKEQEKANIQAEVGNTKLSEQQLEELAVRRLQVQEAHEQWADRSTQINEELVLGDKVLAMRMAEIGVVQDDSKRQEIDDLKTLTDSRRAMVDTTAANIETLKDQMEVQRSLGQEEEAEVTRKQILNEEEKLRNEELEYEKALKQEQVVLEQYYNECIERAAEAEKNSAEGTEEHTRAIEAKMAAEQQLANVQQRGIAVQNMNNTSIKAATLSLWANIKAQLTFKAMFNAVKGSIIRGMAQISAAFASNPIGLILEIAAALWAAGSALYRFFSQETAGEKQQKEFMEQQAKYEAQAQSEIDTLDRLRGAAKRAYDSGDMQEYQKIKNQIISQYGQYNDLLRTEIDDVIAGGNAYANLAALIKKANDERGKMAVTGDLQNQIKEEDTTLTTKLRGIMDDKKVDAKTQGNSMEVIRQVLKEITNNPDKYNNPEDNRVNLENAFRQIVGKEQTEALKEQVGSWRKVSNAVMDYIENVKTLKKNLNGLDDGSIHMVEGGGGNANKVTPPKVQLKDLEGQLTNFSQDVAQATTDVLEDASDTNQKTLKSQEDTYKSQLDSFKKALTGEAQTMSNDELNKEIGNAETRMQALHKQIEDGTKAIAANQQVEAQNEQALAEVEQQIAGYQNMANDVNSTNQQKVWANQQIAILEQQKQGLLQTKQTYDAQRQQVIVAQKQIGLEKEKVTIFRNQKKVLQEGEDITIGLNTNELIKKEAEITAAIISIKQNIAKNGITTEDLLNLEDMNSKLKQVQDKLSTLTGGKDWAKTFRKEREEAIREQEKIMSSAIDNEVAKRTAAYKADLAKMRADAKEYEKEHAGIAKNAKYKQNKRIKEENLKLQFELDIANLTKQFTEWKKDMQQERLQLYVDINRSVLEQGLNSAATQEQKNLYRNAIRQQETERIKTDNTSQRNDKIKETVGVAAYTAYSNGDMTKLTKEQTDQILAIEEEFRKREEALLQQKSIQENIEDVEDYSGRFQGYLAAMVKAQEEYQTAVKEANEGDQYNRDNKLQQAERLFLAAKEQAETEFGSIEMFGEDDQKRLQSIIEIAGKAAVLSADSVMKLIDDAIQGIKDENDILFQTLKGTQEQLSQTHLNLIGEEDKKRAEQIAEAQWSEQTGLIRKEDGTVREMTAEEKQQNSETLEQLKNENGDLTEEQLAQMQTYIDLQKQMLEIQGQMNNNQAVLNQLHEMRNSSAQRANETEKRSILVSNNLLQNTAKGFSEVQKASDAISQTFGKVLSKNAKKAVQSISNIAGAASSSINTILQLIPMIGSMSTITQTEVEGVTVFSVAGIETTSAAAATAIRAVETASVILAIISAAIQIVTAIADALTSLIKSDTQKQQEALDDNQEKLERMQKQLDTLDWENSLKKGSDYYKGLSKAAKQAERNVTQAYQNMLDAQRIYQETAAKYGKDSDKAKEAQEQLDEMTQQYQDAFSDVQDRYEEMLEELTTTSLDDFSSSMADALIEGFEQGREGINDAWTDTLKDLEKEMMKASLTTALKDLYKDTFDNISKNLTGDGELTQTEIDTMISELDAKSEQAKYIAERYYDLMQERGLLDDADAEGSEGFGQMTQDTAEALNARFTALQIEGSNVVAATQAMQAMLGDMQTDVKGLNPILSALLLNSDMGLQLAQEQIDQLNIIANNTAMLNETNDRLNSISQKVANL
ncbi:MAG: hypothetical protein IJS13_07095 [Paludibacteraceae bacterium]|nr:hypothetical protein [Paludibacteraceae bacterium]